MATKSERVASEARRAAQQKKTKARQAKLAKVAKKKARDSSVDTAQPGVSATDRKAGGKSTAARNLKKKAKGGAALEDSATGRPSRKSTRKSSNRTKRDSNLKRRQTRATTAAKARARRSAATGK